MILVVTARFMGDGPLANRDAEGVAATVSLQSNDLPFTLDQMMDAWESLEELVGSTVDHGGTDAVYDLDLPDVCDDRIQAVQAVSAVYFTAMTLLEKVGV